jgi:hypothetical protein
MDSLMTMRMPTMYIQYFSRKDFSGSGCATWPWGVKGGGTRSSGLELEFTSLVTAGGVGTYKGGVVG